MWKIRSQEARADWRMLYLSLMSFMGLKNFCAYSRKATSVPNVMAPEMTCTPPRQSRRATATEEKSSTPGK